MRDHMVDLENQSRESILFGVVGTGYVLSYTSLYCLSAIYVEC